MQFFTPGVGLTGFAEPDRWLVQMASHRRVAGVLLMHAGRKHFTHHPGDAGVVTGCPDSRPFANNLRYGDSDISHVKRLGLHEFYVNLRGLKLGSHYLRIPTSFQREPSTFSSFHIHRKS